MKTFFTLLFLTSIGSSFGSDEVVSLYPCEERELSRRIFHTENSTDTITELEVIRCEAIATGQCQGQQRNHMSRDSRVLVRAKSRIFYKEKILMKRRSITEYKGVVYSCGNIKGLL